AGELLLRLRVLAARELIGLRPDDLHEIVVLAYCPRQLHQIRRRRVLALRIEAGGVDRVRVRHAQFLGLRVHQLHGLVLTAGCRSLGHAPGSERSEVLVGRWYVSLRTSLAALVGSPAAGGPPGALRGAWAPGSGIGMAGEWACGSFPCSFGPDGECLTSGGGS